MSSGGPVETDVGKGTQAWSLMVAAIGSPPAPGSLAIGLKDYLEHLAAVVAGTPAAWVKCDILLIRVTAKYARYELAQADGDGKVVARVAAGCFRGRHDRHAAVFAAKGHELRVGLSVLMRLQGGLHAVFGFELQVLSIDVEYTVGTAEARIAAIRATLADEGVLRQNRLLPRPADFMSVAVVSPQGAAGLGDFTSTMAGLAARRITRFEYFEAPFMGAAAAAGICRVLSRISVDAAAGRFCAVVLIRGGGASSDLAWLADLPLARAVCAMPVPVIVGIGHARDSTLLDEIACVACDTPSKAAELIRSTVTSAALSAGACLEAIAGQASRDAALLTAGSRQARWETASGSRALIGRAAASGRRSSASIRIDVSALLANSASAKDALAGVCRGSAREAPERCAASLGSVVLASAERGMHSLGASRSALAELMLRIRDLPPAALEAASAAAMEAGQTLSRSTVAVLESASASVAGLGRGAPTQTFSWLSRCSVGIAGLMSRLDWSLGNAFASLSSGVAATAEECGGCHLQLCEGARLEVMRTLAGGLASAHWEAKALGEGLAQAFVDVEAHSLRRLDSAHLETGALGEAIASDADAAIRGCELQVARISSWASLADPNLILQAGYALLRTVGGTILVNAAQVRSAGSILAELRDGKVPMIIQEEGLR